MNLITYFDFAENDYDFLMMAYRNSSTANAMGYLSQNICEKYLKHVIDNYFIPATPDEVISKESMLKTHSLRKLIRFLENFSDISLSESSKDLMFGIDGFYFSTRYPGEESFEINEKDVEKCIRAVTECREQVSRYLMEQSKEQIISKNDIDFTQIPKLEKADNTDGKLNVKDGAGNIRAMGSKDLKNSIFHEPGTPSLIHKGNNTESRGNKKHQSGKEERI